MKAKSKTDKGSNGFMTIKVEQPPTGIVRTISVPECMTLEDLHECDIAGWVGLDTPEDVERYLAGESAEVKTQKLKEALAHVKVVVSLKTEKAPKMSDEAEDLAQCAVSLRFGQKVQALLRQGEVGTAV